jgi:nucleotide-binding universal stress UspA family protein
MSKNILIAFDDSDNAQRAVEVVAQTFSRKSKVTLFSVAVDTEALCKMNSPELTPYFKSQQSAFCTMEDKKRELVEAALAQAKETLVESGFGEDAIQVKHDTMDEGVARDIIRESKDGYDIVVIGRRGTSGIKEFFFGSTSQKVLNGIKDASVFIVS